MVAYNATLEAEWEGEGLAERKGEFQQSLGLSYEINPRLLFGAEFVHEVAFPDWSDAEPGKFFAGPNVSIRRRNTSGPSSLRTAQSDPRRRANP